MMSKIEAPERIYYTPKTGCVTIPQESGTTVNRSTAFHYTRSDIAEAEAKKRVVEVLNKVNQLESFRSDTNDPILMNFIDQLIQEVSK